MTTDRWKEVKAEIEGNFKIAENYTEDLEPGQAEVIEFLGPAGKMKLKFIVRPKILDKKTSYSNRPGSRMSVDYVFSEDENVSYLEAYNWHEDSQTWQKIESESIF